MHIASLIKARMYSKYEQVYWKYENIEINMINKIYKMPVSLKI